MGNRIVVVTDSTANLPPDLMQSLEIPIIPLNIHWNGVDYLDGATMGADEFYRRLAGCTDCPTTSQPSEGRFIEFFQETARRHAADVLVGVFISSEMSGTFFSAMQARAELPELKIELVDSRSASMGLGFQVLAGVRAVQAGLDLPAVIAQIEAMRERMQVLFIVDTLDYLYRGGRIGGASHFVGSMLNLKPLLSVMDGRVAAIDKVRGRHKSLSRMIDLAVERAGGEPVPEVAIVESGGGEDAVWVEAQVQERLKPGRIYHSVLTPVIGAHTGPGAIGVIFPASQE